MARRYPLKGLTVLVLVDEGVLVPGRLQFVAGNLNRLVVESLRRLGACCHVLSFTDIRSLLNSIDETKSDVVFNLTQHAYGNRENDAHICAVLNLQNIPYTGTDPRGLMLGRDKALSKLIAEKAGFRVPRFFIATRGNVRTPGRIPFPAIVKPRFNDSSEGISQAAFVRTESALNQRVRLLRRLGFNEIICEEFIEGREMAVGILGEEILKPKEFTIGRKGKGAPKLAGYHYKYNPQYRRRWKLKTKIAELTPGLLAKLGEFSNRTAIELGIRDYGRLDVILTPLNEWVFLEANPNPGLSPRGTTWSGTWDSVDYDEMIAGIIWRAYRRRTQM